MALFRPGEAGSFLLSTERENPVAAAKHEPSAALTMAVGRTPGLDLAFLWFSQGFVQCAEFSRGEGWCGDGNCDAVIVIDVSIRQRAERAHR